jgi:plasmid maintenance system antidote protein VapI
MKTGTRRVTPEYDLRLSRYFGTSEGFWLRLQLAADLRRVRAEKGSEIKRPIKPAKRPLAV